jgi:hypothetical protein
MFPTRSSRFLVLGLFILNACAPTLTANAIFTTAFQTLDSGNATDLALTIAAGTGFVKTWLLHNTRTWTTDYKLSFDGGHPMGSKDAYVPNPVRARSQSMLSVNLTAPTSADAYTGKWRMENEQQQPFGNIISVVIDVGPPTACQISSRGHVTTSGHAVPESVTINYGDGAVVTDAHGNYSFTMVSGWSGTVSPSKAKVNPCTFESAHRTCTNATCDLTRQNYIAHGPGSLSK